MRQFLWSPKPTNRETKDLPLKNPYSPVRTISKTNPYKIRTNPYKIKSNSYKLKQTQNKTQYNLFAPQQGAKRTTEA